MRISWVLADNFELPPSLTTDVIKNVGPSWGPYSTWRQCQTDNVVCSNLSTAQQLIKRQFQQHCNLYIAKDHFAELSRPSGVRLFDGTCALQVLNLDEIVCMQLVSSNSDIVLMLGFDLSNTLSAVDINHNHRSKNQLGLMLHTMTTYPQVQWVMVDHPGSLPRAFLDTKTVTCDKLENVLQLLN